MLPDPPPLAAIVIVLCPFVTVMFVPAVIVAAAGAPAEEPISIWPSTRVADCRTPVVVVFEKTAPLILNVADPVPPPATTAVPNTGWADAPCEITGIPDVADGATLFNKLLAPPVWMLY